MEMVLADPQGWDRYEAAKWMTMRRWLEENPDDEFAQEVRTELTVAPKRHVTWTGILWLGCICANRAIK